MWLLLAVPIKLVTAATRFWRCCLLPHIFSSHLRATRKFFLIIQTAADQAYFLFACSITCCSSSAESLPQRIHLRLLC